MLGRTPSNIRICRPLKEDATADFEMAGAMLHNFFKRVYGSAWAVRFERRLVIAMPSGSTDKVRQFIVEFAEREGATAVHLVDKCMAAAVGAGLPVTSATGSMIINIGGGTTEAAIISLAGIISYRSVPVAGDKLDQAIIEHLHIAHNMIIGERTAEDIKITIGSALPWAEETEMEVRGRNVATEYPHTVTLTAQEVRDVLAPPLKSMMDCVRDTLAGCPPELLSDLMDRGPVLTGGGALLRGLDKLFTDGTKLPVLVAKDPSNAAVNGTAKLLKDKKFVLRITG